jgi:hypothetical protein
MADQDWTEVKLKPRKPAGSRPPDALAAKSAGAQVETQKKCMLLHLHLRCSNGSSLP